jgi:ADP-ribose pyrophosphatase
LASGRHLRLMVRRGWEFVERPGVAGIVVILGVTKRKGLVLVTQWREAVEASVVELPAGLAGDRPGAEGEDLAEAAKRELLEETGFTAEALVRFQSGPPSAGISNEMLTFYRAQGLRRIHRGGGEPGEGVRAHVVPLRRLDEWLGKMQARGYQIDPKVLAGAYWAIRDLERAGP